MRVMQRSQRYVVFYLLNYFLVEKDAPVKTLAAVDDPVSDARYLFYVFDYSGSAVNKSLCNNLKAFLMIFYLYRLLFAYLLFSLFLGKKRFLLSYLFHAAVCKKRLCRHLENLEFYRRTATVYNQYFHLF